jgi:hypothetical protein
MIDLADVPDDRPLPRARFEADQELLRALAFAEGGRTTRGARRGVIVAGFAGVMLVAAGGVAAAGALLAGQPATDRSIGRCYTAISTDFGDDFPGTSMSNAARPGQTAPELPPLALENCAAAWRAGVIAAPGTQPKPDAAGEYPVPPLVACVLPSGEAAVFPGSAGTCSILGLPPLDE